MKRDLSNFNSLTGFMKRHSEILFNLLSDKNVDSNKLINFFENGIKVENVSIKDKTEQKFINTLRMYKNNKNKLIQFILNTMLRGMGLGIK